MPKKKALKCLRPRLAPSAGTGTWAPDTVRGNRHARGYGSAWEKLRKVVIARDQGLCQSCLRADRITLGTEVHHKIKKASGGSDDLSNLELICSPCHLAETAGESQR